MKTIKFILFFCCLSLISCSGKKLEHKPFTMDEMMIQVYDTSRAVAYTNKEAGFYYTETNAPQKSSWQGWHIMAAKMMDDYQIAIDRKPLNRHDVQITEVYPHQFIRSYKAGARERVTMLDSVNAIVIELDRIQGKRLSVVPLFNQPESDYQTAVVGRTLLIASKHHLQRTEKENFPVWIGVTTREENSYCDTTSSRTGQTSGIGRIDLDLTGDAAGIIFAAGDTKQEAVDLVVRVANNYQSMIGQRKTRMEKLLNASYLRTNDERLTKALNWSKLSLDALLMNQVRKGIFAGLPWFDDYWGRDSYITLPGAAIVNGDFRDAKEIIRSFADWQDHNSESPTCGRIPNLVTTNSMAYNTTDGTPWFINALDMYVKYSNDTGFIREMYPTVFLAIEGALAHHVDSLEFMTHADAETWMDAVGPNGPWSPRGNRANEIQALWYNEMKSAIAFAQRAGDYGAAAYWNGIIHNIQYNFNKYYLDPAAGMVYDHLNPDGTPDHQIRPNQLFTLPIIEREDIKARVFRNVTEKLVYPWGVASLSQDDENFHPYHHYEPYYVQDAAYHNGIVWTWLYGRWIDAATYFHQENLAYTVTENMTHQVLDRGAVGTLSELTDALPRPGRTEPELSGTFSQAWSLAEYLRSFSQGYLGCTVDASVPRITLAPHLPQALTDVEFTIPVADWNISAWYHIADGTGEITLASPAGAKDIDLRLEWMFPDTTVHIMGTSLPAGSTIRLKLREKDVIVESPSGSKMLDAGIVEHNIPPAFFNGMKLAAPELKKDLKALKGPDYRVLRRNDIKANPAGAMLITDASDPEGDDNGGGRYTYPTNPNLKPGSLDITHFTVKADENNVYFTLTFRNLSNPGWHPEYGFQLTYAAIAIDKDGNAGSGGVDVGMNSHYILNKSDAFEDIIYVGGGFRVADLSGKVLAEYLPAPDDVQDPLGNVETRTISFAMPVSIIGRAEQSWRYTVLTGAQDDHGGAGVGEFRVVGKESGEWTGGGKKNPKDPNVYDVLVVGNSEKGK